MDLKFLGLFRLVLFRFPENPKRNLNMDAFCFITQ